MLNTYAILDADSHVTEPDAMWTTYLEPAFTSLAPRQLTLEGRPVYDRVSDRLWQELPKAMAQKYNQMEQGGHDPEARVAMMAKLGIDVTFLYPTVGLWMLAIDSMDAGLAGALTRAYNNWLRDFCSYDPQKLQGVGAVNLHAPEEMVPELHRIVEFGWRAVYVRPNPIKGRLLSDPAYEPFWSECDRLGMAVSIHEGTHSRLPTAGANRFNTRFALHACSHPMEQMMALLTLIEAGVLERHPTLRVGFLEAGCGWLPYWLWRLDEEYENLQWEVGETVKMKPSDYFRRQCFVSIEPTEPYLPDLIRWIGPDNLLFGSDYPHIDHSPAIIEQAVALEEQLSKPTVQKILWDNSVRFYGLK